MRKPKTPTYISWRALKTRCLNPNHARHARYAPLWYEPWREFARFLADMGERPPGMSLDRIDNEKGYGPDNCRWATPHEQASNRRHAKLTLEDVRAIRAAEGTMPRAEMALKWGISQSHLCGVIKGNYWK